jgi:pyruvate,orthophosphate dikinase
MQQSDFEGIFEAMAGLPVTIRLLDPPLHEFLPAEEEAPTTGCAGASARCASRTRCSARAAAARADVPEIYEMQVRAIVRAALAVSERTGEAPLVEIMHPARRLRRGAAPLRELTVRTIAEEGQIEYLCGTMIELPRACMRADEIAEHADFFSFGTNDLTQTALGFSRDDARASSSRTTSSTASSSRTRSRRSTARRRRPDAHRRRARPRRQGGPEAGHLRRARRRGESVAFCDELGLDYVSCSPYRVPLAAALPPRRPHVTPRPAAAEYVAAGG